MHTKIIATLGPATQTEETMPSLVHPGASSFRLFSTGDVVGVTAGQPMRGQLQTQTNIVKVHEK